MESNFSLIGGIVLLLLSWGGVFHLWLRGFQDTASVGAIMSIVYWWSSKNKARKYIEGYLNLRFETNGSFKEVYHTTLGCIGLPHDVNSPNYIEKLISESKDSEWLKRLDYARKAVDARIKAFDYVTVVIKRAITKAK